MLIALKEVNGPKGEKDSDCLTFLLLLSPLFSLFQLQCLPVLFQTYRAGSHLRSPVTTIPTARNVLSYVLMDYFLVPTQMSPLRHVFPRQCI